MTPFQDERVLWVGTPARIRVLDKVGKIWLGFAVTDGLGTIRFGGGPSAIETMNTAVSSFGQKVPLVLWDIEDAPRVRDIIITAQGGSR